MALPTAATLVYRINAFGSNPTALAASIDKSVVPLDPSYGVLSSTTTTSDTSAAGGSNATRTVVQNLVQGPTLLAPRNGLSPKGVQFQPFVVSTSPNDTGSTPPGSGARTVTLNYVDAAGASHTETKALNGTTPVQLSNVNYRALTNAGAPGIGIASHGADGSNDGKITVYVPLFAWLGADDPEDVPPGIVVLATLDMGFYRKNPNASLWTRQFQGWLRAPLRRRVGSVIEQLVTFA